MAKHTRHIGRYLLSFALSAVFLYVAFRGIDPAALWRSLSGVSWYWVALLFAGGIGSHVLRAWRWLYLLAPVKKSVSLRNSFSGVMIGLMVNSVLPRVGEVARPFALGRLEGISKSSALGTVVIERILDAIAFMFFLLLVLGVYLGSLGGLVPALVSLEPLFFAGAVVLFLFCIVLFLKAEWFLSYGRYLAVLFPGRIRTLVETKFTSFVSGFAVARRPRSYLAIGALSLAIWGMYILLMYVPFFAFDLVRTNGLTLGAAALLMIVSGVAFLIPAPSAFGTYHSFTSFALTAMFGVDPIVALSFSILTHEVGFLINMGFGLYYILHDHVHVRDVVGESEPNGKEAA